MGTTAGELATEGVNAPVVASSVRDAGHRPSARQAGSGTLRREVHFIVYITLRHNCLPGRRQRLGSMAATDTGLLPCLLRLRMLRKCGRAICLCQRDDRAERVRAAVPFSTAAEAAAWWEACREAAPCARVTDAQLSFAFTTAAAVKRLVLARRMPAPCSASGYVPALRVHFVGADITEGATPASVVDGLRPLLLVLAAGWPAVHILLAGPGVAGVAARMRGRPAVVRPLDGVHREFWCVRPARACCRSFMVGADRMRARASVLLRADAGLYHELGKQSWFTAPHVLCTYNSGFWGTSAAPCLTPQLHSSTGDPRAPACSLHALAGYDSWVPTLRYLARCTRHPCVSTAYNALEAEDDEDVLEEAGISCWVWPPEPNPHASAVAHEPQPPMYRTLTDNAVWQCFTGNVKRGLGKAD